MAGRYTGWAGPLEEVGRFKWERIIKKSAFNQPATKLLALLLATYADGDGKKIHPGRERLMTESGLSKGYVSTHLGKIEDLGMIFKIHNGSSYGRRGGLASVYQLTVPKDIHEEYQRDPESKVQIPLEWLWQEHLHPTPEQVHPSEPVPQIPEAVASPRESVAEDAESTASTPPEQVHSIEEQVHSTPEQVHSIEEQVHPSEPHQTKTPINNHHPKNHQSVSRRSSPKLTHASEPVDNPNNGNGSYTGAGMEDERRRQMDALQKLIEKEKGSAA